MRILNVTQAYYPFLEKGGPTVKVRAIARGMAARGHRVTVLTADLGFTPATAQAAGAAPGSWGWQAEHEGIEVIYLGNLARYRTLTWNPGAWRFCRERLPEFDVVHIYGLYDLLGPVAARGCRRAGVPYIVEPMGMFRPIVRSLWLKRLYHVLLGSRMVRGARRLIATAEQERRELLEGGIPASQVVVRRNGIEVPARLPPPDTFRRQWNIAPETKLVLFLGRLVTKKSPELLLEAFASWRSRAPDSEGALLVVAGPDEGDGYRKKLETFSASLGLTQGALFTGPLYDDAKWAAYRDADVFVLPSQNENFGNTAAEAVACGTPVIVTDCCGIAPLVDQRSGLVVAHDRGALESALGRLLQDDALRQRLRDACAKVACDLTWDEPLAKMESLYLELVAESRRGRRVTPFSEASGF